ncbi:MAG: hypothetical protein ABSE25_05090 [Syntrophorhabdales bacterium]
MKPKVLFQRVDDHGSVVLCHEVGDAPVKVVILQHLLYQISVKNRPLARAWSMVLQVLRQF